jgi:hypothetical protein
MQNLARCFKCTEQIDYDPVFEAPCGHDGCRSAVFHGICLMEWREHREELRKKMPSAYIVVFEHSEFRGF